MNIVTRVLEVLVDEEAAAVIAASDPAGSTWLGSTALLLALGVVAIRLHRAPAGGEG